MVVTCQEEKALPSLFFLRVFAVKYFQGMVRSTSFKRRLINLIYGDWLPPRLFFVAELPFVYNRELGVGLIRLGATRILLTCRTPAHTLEISILVNLAY